MSWRRMTGAVAVGSFLVAMTATGVVAQQNRPDADQMFQMLDANQDGKLTLGEGGPGSQQMLRQLFTMAKKGDSDSISREELRRLVEEHRRNTSGSRPAEAARPAENAAPNVPANAGRDGSLLMRLADANSDGKLSREELARLVDRFNDWDRNRDGQIDEAELQAATNPPPAASPQDEDPSRRPANRTRPMPGNASAPSSNRSATTTNASLQTRLAGTWRGWVVDGRGENPNAGHMEMELQVEGNRMTAREVGTRRAPAEGLGAGTFTVTGAGNTGSLDAVQTAGQHQGREYPGIFELNGDTLKWCVNNRNNTRPTSFESGRGNYFMILRRQR